MLDQNTFTKYHLPPFIWGGIIFVVSSIPSEKIPDIQIFGIDKIIHISIFFIFGLLVYRSIYFSKGANYSFNKIATNVILIVAAFGILDELYQGLIPGRTTDIFDFIADLIGGILSVFFARTFISFRSEEKA